MEFVQHMQPRVSRPIMIAGMQDMGNVGSIVIDFIAERLEAKMFRTARPSLPAHVVDMGGYIDLPKEEWAYRYTDDIILFGGGGGQPHNVTELNELCKDAIAVARDYSVKFIYVVGGLHTDREFGTSPRTYVTSTSQDLKVRMESLGMHVTRRSMITGFNGLFLGFAKMNEIQGVGMYGELHSPEIPQYRAAASIVKTLERLTYRRLGDISRLEMMATMVERDAKDR